MRSPPPHHAILGADERTNNPRDTHADNLRASLLRRLPPHVAKDIIDIPPGHSFHDIGIERDRRLRLLVRRYVNQIQYGCLNRNCPTPTCLSYRKRNSKGPIRAYSDLSARSLACHLIEENSKAGKDPNGALCQNQPVVPWYQDPTRPHRPRSRSDRTTNEATQTARIIPSHSASRRRSPEKREQNQDEQHSDSRPRTPDESIQLQEGAFGASTIFYSKALSTTKISNEAAQLVEHDPSQQVQLATPTKRDPASFTQSLWDTVALRSVDTTRRDPTNPQPLDTLQSSNTLNLPFHLNTAFCGLTLRRLSWSSLHWLQSTKASIEDVSGTPFETFIRNSLFYSLNNARRLCDSAATWKSSAETDASHVFEGLMKSPNDPTQFDDSDNHNCTAPSKINTRFELQAALFAFQTIAASGPGLDGLLSMLRASIQDCYTISNLQNRASQQNRLSASLTRSKDPSKSAELSSTDHPGSQKVAEVMLLALLAMIHPLAHTSLTDRGFDSIQFGHIIRARSVHSSYPSVVFHSGLEPASNGPHAPFRVSIDVADILENPQLRKLSTSLMNCMSHHLALEAMEGARSPPHQCQGQQSVIDMVLDRLRDNLPCVHLNRHIPVRIVFGIGVLEIARNVVAKKWDREPIIKRTSPVGGALEFLKRLYHKRDAFYLTKECFQFAFIAEAFADPETLTQWLIFEPSGQYMHILSFTFLLDTATLVKYFRSINVAVMRKTYETAAAFGVDAKQFLQISLIPVYGSREVLAGMRTRMAKYFVLTIRRSDILEDAINQLWRRERREILRPLRVMLGKDEGEDGIDHGGVQQEFFRLAFAEAFDPAMGMFTVDERTYMTWFQSGSYEPLYKFEALGILMSLAIYNAVTLPITMPLAFYRKLLGLKVKKLEHIADGWPDLANGLGGLLKFDDDVAEVIGRTYEFSYNFAGSTINVDMQKEGDRLSGTQTASKRGKEKSKSTSFELPVLLDITPPSQSPPTEVVRKLSRTSSLKGISTPLSLESDSGEEAALVTNENRERYVKDYVHWLTDKSIRPQWEAFAKGFFTCIDRTALTLFTPEQLQHMIEGHRDISIDELEGTATYEEYNRDSSYIRDFWAVVRSFTPEQHRHLLEFVTASNRVPVNGMGSVNFVIQKHGEEDNRLPSSGTCYQRLLLPQYSTKQILAEKLSKALENSLGFGSI